MAGCCLADFERMAQSRMNNKDGAVCKQFTALRRSAFLFFQQSAKFKKSQEEYKHAKAQFDAEVEEYLNADSSRGNVVQFEYDGYANGYDGVVTVRRSQHVTVEFDPDAVEKALGKVLAANVITKIYEVLEMPQLVQYLKSCGVDPATFKSFIHVQKQVDVKALDRMEELGGISKKQLEGCYTIKKGEPYYTITSKKGQDNAE